VDINLPREQVITLFDNPDNMQHWQDGFVSFERLTGGIREIGSTAKITYNNKGREMILQETLEVYNLPEEMTGFYEHKMMDNKMQNLFEELSSDKTRWTANIHYTRMAFIMKLMGWIKPSMFKNQVQKWMDQFKAFVEK
jgi:hypothetical protein